MDWISDVEISNPKSEENRSRGKSLCINQLPANYAQEKCAKSTMASTLRRLGEETFKGVTHKPTEEATDNKIKHASFYKSSNLPLRFLSTLV
ncbi:coiled-coil domain-containing protein 138-like [Xenopus laevis]|uniref:Coiled-coil domain-containing protein 138-like n=1 Tax=Xenopus laevis TaxID=8355 RepID=A0A8J1MGB8_XENLA|nr:coiled-coil domain-containing protein 138-like [Xenopus laevis]